MRHQPWEAAETRDRTITSLAILKVNYDRRGWDYIDYFVPFVGEILRTSESDSLSIGDVDLAIRTRFGLKLPRAPLQTILRRASKRGLVRIEHSQYRPIRSKLDGSEFETARDTAVAQQALLIDRFCAFASPLVGHEITPDDASAALLGYVQQRGVAFLRHVIDTLGSVSASHAPVQFKTSQAKYVVAVTVRLR